MNTIIKNVYLLAILFISVNAFAQLPTGTKEGGYTSAAEFKNNTPKYPSGFTVAKRSRTTIIMWGGNDYEVESTEKSIKSSTIKKEIWGVVKQDTLYLNAKPLTGYAGYTKVEVYGKYLYVKPAFPTYAIQEEMGLTKDPDYTFLFGGIGGAIGGAKKALARLPLIYNTQTGDKLVLSKKDILKLLENHSSLKEQYEGEPDKEAEATLVSYLVKLNELEK